MIKVNISLNCYIVKSLTSFLDEESSSNKILYTDSVPSASQEGFVNKFALPIHQQTEPTVFRGNSSSSEESEYRTLVIPNK